MKNIFSLKTSRARMILLFLVDIATIIFDAYISLIIRFKVDNVYYNQVPGEYMTSLNSYIIINVVTTLVIFLVLNLYNRVWSYASLHEAALVVGASILSTAFQAFGMSFLYLPIPRSFHIFLFLLLNHDNVSYTVLLQNRYTYREGWKDPGNDPVNTMVIGAGEAGNIIITEMKTSRHLNRNCGLCD